MRNSRSTITVARWAGLVTAGALVSMSLMATTSSAISFQDLGASVTDAAGAPVRQAGAHPDITVKFSVPPQDSGLPDPYPEEQPHRFELDLPLGLVGNPRAAPAAPEACLKAGPDGNTAVCPVGTQVGIAEVPGLGLFAVYNVVPRSGTPGQFAFNVLGAVVRLNPTVRPGDYGITIDSGTISQGALISGAAVTMWGVPADPVHDPLRYAPILGGLIAFPPSASQEPRRPFLSLPTRCSGGPDVTTARLDGWGSIGNPASQSFSSDLDGLPFITTGCDKLPFSPSLDFAPTSRAADAPSGLDVDLTVPQSDAPDGFATAHVKDVRMVLPDGMTVSPSSARGLGACSPAEIGLGTDTAPACPRSSKLGTVTVETPLLEEPLAGDVILATPDQNPFGSLVALYIVAEGSGVRIKLPGRIDQNQFTGQLTATFANNPQLPFSRLRVRFDGGPNAPLATPTACGRYEGTTEITSWSGKTVTLSSPMVIDQNCGPRGFAPGVSAGSTSSLAAKDTSFVTTITRPDRQQNLSGVTVELPPGHLARIGDVPLCPEADAAAGTCPPGSQTGITRVLSGPGSAPLPVNGKVFLTGPYKGAPYGLSIVVPTAGQAGPFDLGNVVVRARVVVDRKDAHVTVVSDPLPTIIRGFPLRIRQVVVENNRPRFHFNPSSCTAKSVGVGLISTEGARSDTKVPFRVAGCGDLKQDQKISLSFTNKSQTRPGKHPGVEAKMTSKGPGGANLKKVVVNLPLSVALDPKNAKALCKPEERAALKCPAASIVGRASAKSVLKEQLTGPIYFVEGTRRTATGRITSTLPKLWIPLSGGGVTIDVNADSHVSRRKLVSTFNNLPDAPITEFKLRINSGKNGILTIPPSKDGGTCQRDKAIDAQLTGHNGAVKTVRLNAKVAGCKKKSSKKKNSKAGKKRAVKAPARTR